MLQMFKKLVGNFMQWLCSYIAYYHSNASMQNKIHAESTSHSFSFENQVEDFCRCFQSGKKRGPPKTVDFFSKPTKSGRFKTPLFFPRPTTRCRHLNEVSPNQASPSQRNVASQQLFFFRGGHLQFLSRVVGAEKMEAAKKGLNQ